LPQQNLVRFEARREQNGLPAVAIRDLQTKKNIFSTLKLILKQGRA
jgi:hypothetical protein